MNFSLDINIINGCNLNCSYCFENNNEQFKFISSEVLINFKNFIIKLFNEKWFKKNFDGLNLNIWGRRTYIKYKCNNFYFRNI